MAGRLRRTAAVLGGVILGGGLLSLLLGWLLLQSQPGHDFLLRSALRQIPSLIQGDVRVAGVRSDGLLGGFTLQGVEVTGSEGRPILELDSLRIRYSLRGLLAGELVLQPVDLWSPSLTVERAHGDSLLNIQRLLGPADPSATVPSLEPAAGASPSGFRIALRGVAVHDGTVTVRLPMEEGEGLPRGVIEDDPELGGRMQRLRFSEIEAHLAEIDLIGAAEGGERIQFEELSLTGEILSEPFRLEELRGQLRRVGTSLVLEADRIWLPRSEMGGRMTLDWGAPEGLALDLDLEVELLDLADFRWLVPELPEGEGRFHLAGGGPLGGGRWDLTSAELRVGGSRVSGAGGLELGDTLRLVDARIRLEPLSLADLDPWLENPLPVSGQIEGEFALDGPLGALEVGGRLVHRDPGRGLGESVAQFSGFLLLESDAPGVRELRVTVAPLRYALLDPFLPEHPIQGSGRVDLVATGRLATGINLTASAEHRIDDSTLSRVSLRGSIRGGEEIFLALEGGMDPLSTAGLRGGFGVDLPLEGEVRGTLSARGPWGEMELAAEVETAHGPAQAVLLLDLGDPAGGYSGTAAWQGLDLTELLPQLPGATVLSGRIRVAGSGAELAQLEGVGELWIEGSTLGGVEVEHLDVALRAEGGRMRIESLELRSPLLTARGTGELALREEEADGAVALTWEMPDLAYLRPLLQVDAMPPADTLSTLEREMLRLSGIDADTLRVGPPVLALGGSVRGELLVVGHVQDLTAEGFADFTALRYGTVTAERGRIDFVGEWSSEERWGVEAAVQVGAFALERFEFLQGSGELNYTPGRGRLRVDLQRDDVEAYRLRAGVTHDSAGVVTQLEALAFDSEEVEWSLVAPSTIRWSGSVLEVTSFRMARPGAAPGEQVRIEAEGVLDRAGPSDFRVELEGVDLDRLGRLTQVDLPSGVLDLVLTVEGVPEDPEMAGVFRISELVLAGTQLFLLEGSADYSSRVLNLQLEGASETQRILRLDGFLPLDLSLVEVADRTPLLPLDLRLQLEGLSAANALAFLEGIEEVQGTIDGDIRLGGTFEDLRPSGQIRLRGGALALPDIGLRPTGIAADLLLREDATVEVSAEVRSGGGARILGVIGIRELSNPTFDLRVSAENFQAVDRRDITVRLGGDVTLTGSFDAPRIGGALRVDQGVLFLEEFARTAEVIDLTDPTFFDVVDTTFVSVQPIVDAAQNPFLQNLRVDVDLSLQRDFWLRSREMNVEIGGDLIVLFDRPKREVLLVGSLQAIRGAYSNFGRQFQVQSGSVEFIGTPGINPFLNITAAHRLRREGGEPLTIQAQLGGTLLAPTVVLTSDSQPPIAESDLISYLVFGRPSYALASGESSVLRGFSSGAVSAVSGTVAQRLGTVMAQQFGVDYLTITQGDDASGLEMAAGLGGTFAGTEIEVGQYVADNVFLALVLRPLTGLGARSQALPGARVEWRFSDVWSMEGFVEDRFAREGASGFGELGLRLSRVLGVNLFGEWGY